MSDRILALNQGLIPFDAEHHAVDAGADSEQADAITAAIKAGLGADGQADGKRRRAGISKVLERGKVAGGVSAERLEHGSAMGGSDLMATRAVDLSGLPIHSREHLGVAGGTGSDPLGHQAFGVGGHQRPHAIACGLVGSAVTEAMVGGASQRMPSEDSIARATDLLVTDNDTDAGRSDGERGDGKFDALAIPRGISIEMLDGGLDEGSAPFTRDDKRRFDLSQFDHRGGLQDAIEDSQASVGEIVDHTVLGQTERMMDSASRSRFKMVSTDRRMNEGTDAIGRDLCGLQGKSSAADAVIAGKRAFGPEAALADAGHQLEASWRESQTLVERPQTGFDFIAADGFGRERVPESFEADMAKVHAVLTQNFRSDRFWSVVVARILPQRRAERPAANSKARYGKRLRFVRPCALLCGCTLSRALGSC